MDVSIAGGKTFSNKDSVQETASLMAAAHWRGVSHLNKNMTRLTKDQFDTAIEAPLDLYSELYDIYGKGYRSVGNRVPNA